MENPKIRFKGFTKDWEQRKLNEVGVVIDPHPSHRAPKEEQGGIPFIGIGDVDEMGNINRESARPVPENVYDEHHKRYDLNVPSLGLGRVASLGKVIRLRSDIGKYAISPTISVLQFSENINIDYLYAYMNTPQFKKQFEGKSNGSTRQSVGTEMVRLLNLSMPFNLDEQKAIGTFYKNLDNLITLHQRKCEQTKKLKKYMLQKMFPQNGAKVPEIRFYGFTYDWEQRKVTDLGEIYIGLVTTMTEHYTDKGHLLIRNSDIKDGYFEFGENPIYLDEEFSERNKLRMHQLGDVITVHTGDIGTSAVIGENEVNSIGFATIVTRPNQEILDSNYFATYLNTDTHKQWAVSMATGDGRSNYNLKDYTKLVVPIPEIEEQKKIAACIVNLNSLITLHQRKCDELKKMKKYMLQNMFI